MNELNDIVLSICAAAVVGSLMYMLLPEGNLSKVIKTVTGIFVLGCIILPSLSLKDIDFKTEFNTGSFETEDLNSTFNTQLMSTTKDSLENMVRSHFSAKNITVVNIETSMDIDSNNSIFIEGMTVTAECSKPEAETIQNELNSTYGIKITVISADEGSP